MIGDREEAEAGYVAGESVRFGRSAGAIAGAGMGVKVAEIHVKRSGERRVDGNRCGRCCRMGGG